MKISNTLAVVLLSAAVVSADTATTSQSETGNHHTTSKSMLISQTDSIHSMADDSFHTQSGERWLGSLTGLKIFTQDVSTRVTVRLPRLKARSEGALGQAPWYGMAFGLACTTLAAVMLG